MRVALPLVALLSACAWITGDERDARYDLDGDGVPWPDDCDDGDASVAVASDEVCDGLDNDCDGDVDEDLEVSTWFLDADGDGYGDA